MFKYSTKSLERLETCDERLQFIMHEALKLQLVDITIIEGHRTLERQQELFNTVLPDGTRLTQIDGITDIGKHNDNPSRAVDAAPYPIAWNDSGRFCMFAGLVLSIAKSNDIPMRWGGDWDRDFSTLDHNFFDGPHFELM